MIINYPQILTISSSSFGAIAEAKPTETSVNSNFVEEEFNASFHSFTNFPSKLSFCIIPTFFCFNIIVIIII